MQMTYPVGTALMLESDERTELPEVSSEAPRWYEEQVPADPVTAYGVYEYAAAFVGSAGRAAMYPGVTRVDVEIAVGYSPLAS